MRIDKSQREGGRKFEISISLLPLSASSFAHLDCMADVIFMKRERRERERVSSNSESPPMRSPRKHNSPVKERNGGPTM